MRSPLLRALKVGVPFVDRRFFMTASEIVRQRLINQQIAATKFTRPAEIVSWLGAVQAQEFAMARWAIGLRVPGLTDAAIEQAFNRGDFLRTHVLRPTWHFVAPADIRWMLTLTAPRVRAASAYVFRQAGLTSPVFKRARAVLTKTLQGNRYLTRTDLQAALQRARIPADGEKLASLVIDAELEGIICSGPRTGRQFTYTLLDERVAPTKPLDRDAALAKLAVRYFASRGPATAYDFSWWSGLTVTDARAGIESLPANFLRETVNGQTYVFPTPTAISGGFGHTTFLLPEYDEYGISYKDRSALRSPAFDPLASQPSGPPRKYFLVIDGLIAGTWQRREKERTAIVETAFLRSLGQRQRRAVVNAIEKYDAFVSPDDADDL